MKTSPTVADRVSQEITTWTAGEIAQHVASGDLSAREVLEAHIERIEEVNPRLNALVAPRFTEARAEADAADAARIRGEMLGPLHGVPVTVKEQFDVAGLPTTFGLPRRANLIAKRDGPLVGRLRRAGAIILGKTNVPELLFYQESDNPLYGRTNNPWNLDRTPGGGSGGEGAIIAAGGSPLGLAADIGGSIRVPAHFCGIHGLKVTSGRLTNLDSPPQLFFPGFEEVNLDPGPFARSVADLELAMQVLAAPGQEAIDPRIPPVPWPEPRDVSVAGLRVGWFVDDGLFSASPALRRAVREAAAALQARGAEVDEFVPPDAADATWIYYSFLATDGLAWVKPLLPGNEIDRRVRALLQISAVPDALKPLLAQVLTIAGQRRFADTVRSARSRSASGYLKLIVERNRFRSRFLAALDAGRFDVILCPPHALPALTHGATYYLFLAASYSVLFNVLGMPTGILAATRVREGEESDRAPSRDIVDRTAREVEQGSAGLPVGVQIAGRHWREDDVLAVMAALEEHFRAQPDYPSRPPI